MVGAHLGMNTKGTFMQKFLKVWLVMAALITSSTVVAQDEGAAEESTFKSEGDKVSYAIGLQFAQEMKNQGVEISPDMFAKAISHVNAGEDPLLTEDEMRQTLMAFSEKLRSQAQEKAAAASQENLAEAEAFLAENKEKEGIITTESGLQYEIIEEGEGESPTAEDTFIAHYEGSLLDGTVFDSSYERGTPLELPVTQVIPAWTEVLQIMKPGAKYKIYAHPDIAYGERGSPPRIGPNELLVFEMELIGTK